MNFLAHLYLSHNHKEVMIGNFIADGIRGNQFHHFSEAIQFGVQMHRAIDTFTDKHPVFRQSKKRLDPKYKHYKGVIIDLIYDHFLAKNWEQYSEIPLLDYSQKVYYLLQENFDILPERTQYLLPYMTEQNWLCMYQSISGMTSILHDMNVRTKGVSKMNEAIVDLQENYSTLEQDFTQFFEEIKHYSLQYLQNYDSKNTK